MGNHFYGTAVNEHYEKDVKKFRAIDWIAVCIYFGIAIGAVIAGFMMHWGIMIGIIGLLGCLCPVLVRVVFGARSKAALIFLPIGILAIVAGIIVEAELWDAFQYFVVIAFMLVAFGVAIICLVIKIKNSAKMRKYSLTVEAICEMVDVRRINLFTFDDRVPNYNSAFNANTLYKPGFHYIVNGTEYFTESKVYYGNLNKGFKEGNKVVLKVNPNNPNEMLPADADSTTANMALVMSIFWFIGGIAAIIILLLMLSGVISFY